MDDTQVNTGQPQPNPTAAGAVEGAKAPNSNGIPGSLPGETRAETQARLYKVTVDGEDLEVDETELKRGYAHARAAAKRMQEAGSKRKEAESVLRIMKENPEQAFKKLGLDPRQFAQQIIDRELEEAMLTPEQRELRDYKQRVAAYENERRRAEEEYRNQQMQQAIARETETIQRDIIDTLSNSGLPQNEKTVSRIVYYMRAAHSAGHNVRPVDVIDQVKQDYREDIRALMGGLPEEALNTFLDEDIIRKVNKSMVKTLKTAPATVPKTVNQDIKRPKADKKPRSPRDFFNQGF